MHHWCRIFQAIKLQFNDSLVHLMSFRLLENINLTHVFPHNNGQLRIKFKERNRCEMSTATSFEKASAHSTQPVLMCNSQVEYRPVCLTN